MLREPEQLGSWIIEGGEIWKTVFFGGWLHFSCLARWHGVWWDGLHQIAFLGHFQRRISISFHSISVCTGEE